MNFLLRNDLNELRSQLRDLKALVLKQGLAILALRLEANGLSPKQINMLVHCVGADSDQPGYRNRFITRDMDMVGEELIDKGLFNKTAESHKDMVCYFATDKAFDLLGFKETT